MLDLQCLPQLNCFLSVAPDVLTALQREVEFQQSESQINTSFAIQCLATLQDELIAYD